MNGMLKPLLEINSFNEIIKDIKKNKQPILATNVIDSQKIHLASGLQIYLNKPSLFITYSEVKAKEIYDDLQYFFGENVYLYPSKDILFYSADVRSMGITKERFKVFEKLLNKEKISIVLSVEALFDRLTDKEYFESTIIDLEIGFKIEQEKLINNLIFLGYERVDLVEGVGQLAIRGGIIDIFPVNYENALRIEFWGDEIDSIRLLDSLSQRSIEKIENAHILPVRELVFSEEILNIGIEKIKDELKKTLKIYEKKSLLEEAEKLNINYNEVLEKMQNLKNFNGIESYSNYFYEEDHSLLDYIDEDCLLFIDEPNRVASISETVFFEFEESIKNRILKGYFLPSSINMVLSYPKILKKMQNFKKILLSSLTQSIKDFNIKDIQSFEVKSKTLVHEKLDLLVDDLKYYCKNKYKILVLAGSNLRSEKLLHELSESNISCKILSNLDEYDFSPSVVTISTGNLNKSFEYPSIKFIVISDKELFSYEKKIKKNKKKKKGTKIESFTDLKIGDYVVHENHGIGIYNGIEKIITDNISKDYLKLSYKDGGNLYIPTSQMDMIQKYIGGGEGASIKLNKLGGADWKKSKQRAKNQVAIIAKDLIKLYAQRLSNKGYIFSKDTVWQKEFEDQFPYEETEDQKIAIDDVKKDMESNKVMDRLICGDVGYGKTEIAIRASFKAVQDGKQVAYLVPTTILAQQHFNTFFQRMSEFPIRVEMLSRFKTPKQQKEIINAVNKGSVDIVIGTHKILSKEINFKSLGLIIIDEEQRFGVAQKEKLKSIKENIDVMSLSATPIPRTLHMSLTGIRDISTLEEPPLERQPIQTYVMEYSDEFVKDAINREIGRGGQVFYLHNRVRNISEVSNRVQKLVPDVNVQYAHGQMSERELENIMIDFIEGKIDVLVCTTIIETGLDISNANTIIIQDADYMGLSQLYQLRGRVGRSSRTAYAYLMYKKDKVLNEIAEKRLQTIREFTEFGSGFKIALRDLEIRGTGNLLGAEQHGYMDAVGYDLYCKLLDEEIRRLKGEKIKEDFETSIDITINAFIPSFYISNEEQKLEVYKKISFIKDQDDYFEVQEEIEDRFGNLPQSVQNLLDIAFTKSIAHNKDITSISEKNNSYIITLSPDANVDPINLTKIISSNKNKMSFTAQLPPYITLKKDKNNKPESELKFLKEFLLSL